MKLNGDLQLELYTSDEVPLSDVKTDEEWSLKKGDLSKEVLKGVYEMQSTNIC